MAKRVIKVAITGYYLIDDDLPEDVLGTATTEEFIKQQLDELCNSYDEEDVRELVDTMLEGMRTLPTIRVELKD